MIEGMRMDVVMADGSVESREIQSFTFHDYGLGFEYQPMLKDGEESFRYIDGTVRVVKVR